MEFNEKPRVVSDVDGVVAHSQEPILEIFNARFGTELTYANWGTFSLLMDEAVRLSGESPAVIAAWLFSAEVVGRAPTVPGAKEAMTFLAERGVIPQFVTSRPGSQAGITKGWFATELPEVTNVYLKDELQADMPGEEFKLERITQLLAEVYIDDDPAVIQHVSAAAARGALSHVKVILLVDRPWNEQYACPSNVTRVGSWKEHDFGWSAIAQIVRQHMSETFISQHAVSSEKIVEYFQQEFPELFDADAGVWENLTIRQHTERVLLQFDRYFAGKPLPLGVSTEFFRVVLALHDIGKPLAILKDGDKRLQHKHTAPIMYETLTKLGFSDLETALGVSLVSGDPLGAVIKGNSLGAAAEWFTQAAEVAGVLPTELLDLVLVLFQVDAGSYTKNAGGPESLDRLFVFDLEQGVMRLADEPAQRVTALRALL